MPTSALTCTQTSKIFFFNSFSLIINGILFLFWWGRRGWFFFALFAFLKNLFVLQKNLSTRSYQNSLKCHQNSKILSRRFGGLLFFVRQQKSLFLNGILRLGHVIWWTWPTIVPLICDIFSYTKTFACLRCEQGYKNKKFVGTEFSISLQMPNSIFLAISANRAFAKKIFVLFRFLSHFMYS